MKIPIIALFTFVILTNQVYAFSDLDKSHWAYNNVMEMQEKGIVSGYNDDTFKPDTSLTREQFITMLVNALGLTNSGKGNFTDIYNRWSTEYIKIAGYCLVDDGETIFNPAGQALREDVAMGIVKAKGLENSEYDINTLNNFSDLNSISANRRKYVAIAVENGFMNGNANGTFNPKGALTRAEGATVVNNLLSNISGFQNESTVREIVPCIYDNVRAFSEGLAAVKKDEKWGYINKNGEVVIPFCYDEADEFSEDLAAVSIDEKIFNIDKTGKKVLDDENGLITRFSEGLAVKIKDEKFGYVNKKGEEIIACDYDWGSEFSNGLAKVSKNLKYGMINTLGEEVIPCIYDRIYAEEDKRSDTFFTAEKDGKMGILDREGNEIVPFVYDLITEFSEGLVKVQKNGKFGFVNEQGEEIVSCIYDDVGFCSSGVIACTKNGQYAYIDRNGNEVMRVDYIIDDFYDGMARIVKNEKVGYINLNGEEVIPCIYDWGGIFSESAVICKNNKYGVINKSGDEILPCIYEGMMSFEGFAEPNRINFSKGFLKVIQNGQYGLINKYGTEVLPCIYEEIYHLSEGTVSVKKGGKYGFVEL